MTRLLTCSQCNQLKPDEDFGVNSNTRRGRYAACRQCKRAKDAAYRESLRSRRAQPPTLKMCPMCRKLLTADQYRKNVSAPCGLMSRCKSCLRTIRHAVEARRKAARPLDCRARKNIRSARRRARKFGRECTITWQDWVLMYNSQNGKCAVTGIPFDFNVLANTASLDRIDSGQGYVQGNVRLVLQRVNASKRQLSDSNLLARSLAILHSRGMADIALAVVTGLLPQAHGD